MKKWTQEEAAAKARCSDRYIRKLEANKACPSWSFLVDYAKLLDADINDIINPFSAAKMVQKIFEDYINLGPKAVELHDSLLAQDVVIKALDDVNVERLPFARREMGPMGVRDYINRWFDEFVAPNNIRKPKVEVANVNAAFVSAVGELQKKHKMTKTIAPIMFVFLFEDMKINKIIHQFDYIALEKYLHGCVRNR